MKKIVSSLLVFILVLGTVFAFASCRKLMRGTYERYEDGIKSTVEFNGNKITITTEQNSETYEYYIEDVDGDEYITITDEDGYSEEMDFYRSEDTDNPYIEIGWDRYYKVEDLNQKYN